MKKIIFLLCFIGTMITTISQAQFVRVRNQLTTGAVLNPGISPTCNGVSAGTIICASATGGDSTAYGYQWQSSPTLAGTYSNLATVAEIAAGSKSLSYTTPAMTNSTYFRLQTTDLCGTVYSTPVYIQVYAPFVFVGGVSAISGGTMVPLCFNTSTGTMTAPIVSGGAPITATQWQIATAVDSTSFSDIAGATGLAYINTNLTATSWYRALKINACDTLISTIKKITVYAPFAWTGTNTITGGNTPNCYNTAGGIMTAPTVTGGAPGTVTQWNLATIADSTNFVAIPLANGATRNAGTLTSTIWNTVSQTNTCGVLTSAIKKLEVYNDFVFVSGSNITGGNTPICHNTAGGTMTAPTVTGGAPGTTNQWNLAIVTDSTAFTAIPSANGPTQVAGILTGTTWYNVSYTNTCKSLTSSIKKIKVWGIFNPGVVTTDTITICYGTAPMPFTNLVSPSGGDGVYSYLWIQDPTNNFITLPVTPAVGTNNVANYQPPTLTSQMGYRRQVTNATCGNTANSIAQ